MRAPLLPPALPALLATACGGWDPADLSGRDACRVVEGEKDWGERYVVVPLDEPDLADPVEVEVVWGDGPGLLHDGAAVVVVLSGGFEARISPVEGGGRAVDPGIGFVHLYVNLPVRGGEVSAPGLGDVRGSASRRAAAAALRYAAGDTTDQDGCGLGDRVGVPLSALDPLLHGQSNGGNLAVAVLADPDLDLPGIAGLTTFETPAGAQFATVEVGSVNRPLPLYEEGACAWSAGDGVTCDVDPATLAWAPDEEDPDDPGTLFYDLDGDGVFSDGADWAIEGLRPVFDGVEHLVVSPRLAAQVEDAGLAVPGLFSEGEASAFWSERDAGRLAPSATALHPSLPVIVIGTEEDHRLAAADHPHVTGLAEALQASGAGWLRVNPDAAYAAWAAGVEADYADNPADMAVVTGQQDVVMEVDEETVGVRKSTWTTAALAEIALRTAADRWEPDLDGLIPWDPARRQQDRLVRQERATHGQDPRRR